MKRADRLPFTLQVLIKILSPIERLIEERLSEARGLSKLAFTTSTSMHADYIPPAAQSPPVYKMPW